MNSPPPKKLSPNIKINKTSTRKRTQPSLACHILSSVLKEHGLNKKIARYKFISDWDSIVGSALAKHVKADSIRGNCLILSVKSAAWANDASFYKETILQRLQPYLDDTVKINDIRVVVRPESFTYTPN